MMLGSSSIASSSKSAPTAAVEYKAAELLRSRHRPVLKWLLGHSSPIRGNAYVHLTDTRFFVLARLLDVLLGGNTVSGTSCRGENARTREMAITLYRSGKQNYGPNRWQEFLTLAANLFRTNNRWLPRHRSRRSTPLWTRWPKLR